MLLESILKFTLSIKVPGKLQRKCVHIFTSKLQFAVWKINIVILNLREHLSLLL